MCITAMRGNELLLLRNYPAPQASTRPGESPHAFHNGETGWDIYDVIMTTLAMPMVLPPHVIGIYLLHQIALLTPLKEASLTKVLLQTTLSLLSLWQQKPDCVTL